jgi:hypothetical protein
MPVSGSVNTQVGTQPCQNQQTGGSYGIQTVDPSGYTPSAPHTDSAFTLAMLTQSIMIRQILAMMIALVFIIAKAGNLENLVIEYLPQLFL